MRYFPFHGKVVLRVVIYNESAVMTCENKMATPTGEREKRAGVVYLETDGY